MKLFVVLWTDRSDAQASIECEWYPRKSEAIKRHQAVIQTDASASRYSMDVPTGKEGLAEFLNRLTNGGPMPEREPL